MSELELLTTFTFMLKLVSSFLQIVLLIAFMCITLLVASLVCLTLPGEIWWHKSQPAIFYFVDLNQNHN